MKLCTKCGENKSLEEFSKNARRKDGRQVWCKKCAHARRAEWARENPSKITAYRRLDKYGLTPEQYQNLLNEQNGLCAICSADLSSVTPHIDHDHATGRVRGVLCQFCNIMIGWYEQIRDHERVQKYLNEV